MILVSFSLLNMTTGAVAYFHGYYLAGYILSLGFITTVFGMTLWFKDVITESTLLGDHTKEVVVGLVYGIVLFIISEACAFLSIFWAFFHSSLAPAIELGGVWPPLGIEPLNPFAIPLLNTLLLLSSGVCLKYNNISDFIFICNILPFTSPRIFSIKRIGPHNLDILSILIGSLLGDGTMERDGNGSRFSFYQEKTHGEYLLWLHKTISNLGYCKKDIPVIQTRYGKNGELRYFFRFRTFTYSSFNWIHDEFYPKSLGRKIIPKIIDQYLSPMALAIWIMDDGTRFKNKGLKFCTNAFTLKEIKYLSLILKNKYSLESTIHKLSVVNQYNIYIPKSSINPLIKIVKPYIHPSMYYKIDIT